MCLPAPLVAVDPAAMSAPVTSTDAVVKADQPW